MQWTRIAGFGAAIAVCAALSCSAVAPGSESRLRDSGGPDAAFTDAAGLPDSPPSSLDGGGAAQASARVVVHYSGGPVVLRGDHAGLRWDADSAAVKVGADTYAITLTFAAGEDPALEFKPRFAGIWSLGPNYRVRRGQSVDVYPHFVSTAGRVSRFRSGFVASKLPGTRNLWLYTPPTAIENSAARFPVLYMHDGLNLFDPAQAFGGVAWEVDAALDRGAADGSLREAYVVGVESSADRLNEMTPTRDASEGFGGQGASYLDMIEADIKPLADAELRTLPAREHTAILGSSLGGLISAWAGLTRGGTFGLVGALSPSTFWDNELLVTRAPSFAGNPSRPLRLYVDSGDSGTTQDNLLQTARFAAECRRAGYVDGRDFKYVIGAGDVHNESAWRRRLPGALVFLLGAGR